MSIVFPGVEEVIASPLRPVSILMRLDFPTLERPIKAYSGNVSVGHLVTSVLLMTNSAFVISIFIVNFRKFLTLMEKVESTINKHIERLKRIMPFFLKNVANVL